MNILLCWLSEGLSNIRPLHPARITVFAEFQLEAGIKFSESPAFIVKTPLKANDLLYRDAYANYTTGVNSVE